MNDAALLAGIQSYQKPINRQVYHFPLGNALRGEVEMKNSILLGVISVVLLLTVATVFSPIAIAGVDQMYEGDSLGDDAIEAERPTGTLMGGDGPSPQLTPPDILFCNALPNPEQVGNPVNVSCLILDDLGVVNAWVEITDPDGIVMGNYSMQYDPIFGQWYFEQPYYKAGLHTYTVTAEDQEGQFDFSDDVSQNFLMEDTTPPTISNETAAPDPQNIGQDVNITCDVTDNGVVDEVWVEVYDPSMVSLGNFSMGYDSGTGKWYYEGPYFDIGTHSYTITAYDTAGYFDVATGTFDMEDTTPPQISNPQEVPDPQEVNDFVNISAIITDVDSVAVARLRVVDPSLVEVGNWSMNYDSGNGRYYYNQTYNQIGVYTYEIWTRDPSGNWNFYFGTFTIMADVTPPTIMGEMATPDPQEVFFDVNITAMITDNSAVNGAWVEVMDPLGGIVGNFSMTDFGAGLYYYEQAYTMVGIFSFTIWAEDTFGWWSSASGWFVMQDTTPPVVDLITAVPDPQEVFLQVNVSCRITDNWVVLEAWIEVWDPLGGFVGNFSMDYDSVSGRWFNEQPYDIVGTYTFTIWGSDEDWNWGSNSSSFFMDDTTPPTVTGTTATPNPQQSNSNVNITATVTDNYQVFEAYAEVLDPFAALVGNFSMLWDSVAGQFYYERPYWEIGEYDYTIWASDTSNNWDSLLGNFTIIDTTNPIISDVQRNPQPQEVFLSVNVSAIVTDNYMVQQVVIDILDPLGGNVVNTDMGYDSVSGRYYYTATYDMVGTYTCTIWTRDTMNNQDTTGCNFDMVDTTLPIISGIMNVPDPAEVNAPTNISADISDNYDLDESNIWMEVRDPFGALIGNFSMLDAGGGNFYYERSYSLLGLHSVTIWAADMGGLWSFGQHGFLVDDNTPPTISSVTEVPDPQEVYGNVNISADVTDNYQLAEVKVEVRNPLGGLVGNFTMVYDTGTGRWSHEQAYNMLGTYNTILYARDIRSNVKVAFGSFLIQDTTPPLIQNTVASPDPQDAGGLVRIDADISDNFQMSTVYVEIWDPFMVSIINATMTVGATYWYEQAYTELGTHTFTITAWDSVGNVALDTGSFLVHDISPPVIGTPTETPDPQEVFGIVNVTVDVSDNYRTQIAYIDIMDPMSAPVGNFTMMVDVGIGEYSHEQSYDMLGTYTCTIWARDTSGNWASRACAFLMQDTTIPTISNPTEDPQPQNVGGPVNVSALVSDNFQLNLVRLVVVDPNSFPLGNDTMMFDSVTGRYYWEASYVTVGTYNYDIYAWDTSNNVAGYAGTFQIADWVAPTLTLTQAFPDPQEVYNDVNITSRIEDNLGVIQTANVEITDPTSAFYGNFTMNFHFGSNKFFFLTSYDMLGTFTFVIWASDPAGNWASDTGSFVIEDNTPPDISNIVTTSPQEIDVGAIDISATVTDNFDATSTLQVWIHVLYPDSTLLENVSMTYDAGNDEFDYSVVLQVELGTYDFEIWATDAQGNWNSATGSFVIQDTTDPTADAGPDQSVDQGDTVTFDGSGSSDNDPLFDTDSNYTWTFNDLGAKTIWGIGPSYVFTRGGDYDVTLTVTDRAGNQATDVVTIDVVAGPSPPLNLRVTEPTESTLTISWDPPATYTDGGVLPGTDIKGYTIYRAAAADGPYTELIFVTTLTHTDTGLVRNTTYYYKVTCWSLADDIESERTTWKSGVTTAVTPPPPDDGDGDEQDMTLWMLMLILIIVIVVIAIVAIALLRRKKPAEEEYPEAYEEEYYYEEDLPPPPPA